MDLQLQALVPAALLALTAVLGLVWLVRARAARRWNAVLDAYAEEELTRLRLRHPSQRLQPLSTRGQVLPGPRASKPIHLHS
jgi:hypothetical protein